MCGPQANMRSTRRRPQHLSEPTCSAGASATEFQHVAQDRDSAREFLPRHRRQRRQRGPHRGWIRVVALIDQKRLAAVDLEHARCAAPARRRQIGEHRQAPVRRRPRSPRAQPATASAFSAICRPGIARWTGIRRVAEPNDHLASIVAEASGLRRQRRPAASNRRSPVSRPRPLGDRLQAGRVRIVIFDDRGAARHQALRKFRPSRPQSPRPTESARDARLRPS